MYILAYRDKDNQPDDMAVDIYLTRDGRHVLAGTVGVGGILTGLTTAKLTQESQDIVFQYSAGELQYVSVVRFHDRTARQVFEYGASEIDVVSGANPMIVARSKIANIVEQFTWDATASKFVKSHEFAWRGSRNQ